MAAVLTELIPQQGFEIVLDKLGAILLEEITAQKAMPGANVDNFEVYLERTEPYDKSEGVVLNVSLNTNVYNGKSQADTQGAYTYFIDGYASGAQSQALTANEVVRRKIHRFAAMIRYIFHATAYKNLGFPNGLIGGQMLETIVFDDNYGKEQGSQIRFFRASIVVRVQETQEMWASVPLLGNDTTIKLAETEKGYKLIFNN